MQAWERGPELGWSGDRCPLCRRVRVFRFVQWQAEVWRICSSCEVPLVVGPNVSGKLFTSRADAERNAAVFSHLDAVQDLEVPSGTDRAAALREPFLALEPLLRRVRGPWLDRPARLTLAATLAMAALTLGLGGGLAARSRWLAGLMLLLPSLGLLLTLTLTLTAPLRLVRSRVTEWLALGLRPLGPSEAELNSLLAEQPAFAVLNRAGLRRRLSARS